MVWTIIVENCSWVTHNTGGSAMGGYKGQRRSRGIHSPEVGEVQLIISTFKVIRENYTFCLCKLNAACGYPEILQPYTITSTAQAGAGKEVTLLF